MARPLDSQAGSSEYQAALPPYQFQFPRDHASHPRFRTEWWYYTGHLKNRNRWFGYELTFFQVGINPERRASPSRWALHTLYFAHFTVTDEQQRRFHFGETVSRPAIGLAGSRADRFHVWVHDWSARLLPDQLTHQLSAKGPGFSVALKLTPEKPPVVHGRDGVSQKSAGAGRASHYYSLSRLRTSGDLTLGPSRFPVVGESWMDHEFGSNQLTPHQIGWDWFSIQLDGNRELMLYVLRLRDGTIEPMSSGTIIDRSGKPRHLALKDFQVQSTGTWTSQRSGARYPSGWRIQVPAEKVDLRLIPTIPDQELSTATIKLHYWEGAVRVTGRVGSVPVGGRGYVELTGYAGAVPGI